MQAIRAVQIGRFNVMVLMYTKINDQDYYRNRLRCNVVCSPEITTTSGGAQGVVLLVVKDRPQIFSVELTRFHKINMVSCEVVSRGKRTPLVGRSPPTPLHP